MTFIFEACFSNRLNLLSFSRCVATHEVTSQLRISAILSITFFEFRQDVSGFILVRFFHFYRQRSNLLLWVFWLLESNSCFLDLNLCFLGHGSCCFLILTHFSCCLMAKLTPILASFISIPFLSLANVYPAYEIFQST